MGFFFKYLTKRLKARRYVAFFKCRTFCQSIYFSLSLTHCHMIHTVLRGCFIHWVHLQRVLKMSSQKGRSLCELPDFKQKRGNPMLPIFHVIFPSCSFQASQNILITCITLMTNKSHSIGTYTVKKRIKLPQNFIFLYL